MIYKNIIYGLTALVAGIALFASILYSYLLFHSLTELFSIVIAFSIFVIAWDTRNLSPNTYLLFIGISYFFVAVIDSVHTLGYKGMGIFPGGGANVPTQLWIAGRYLQSISLLVAPYFIGRKLKTVPVFIAYCLASGVLLLLILSGIFPDAFVDGAGLTPFKIASEYIISLILAAAMVYLWKKKEYFDGPVLNKLIWSMGLTIASEMSFTLYTDVYGAFNALGHYFKIGSFYLFYTALVKTNLIKPYESLAIEIDKREKSAEALRESESKFRAIFDQTFQFIGLMTIDGALIEANRTALQLSGVREAEVLNRPFWETVWWTHSPALQAQLRTAVKEAAKGELIRFEATHPASDGSLHYFDFSLKPVKDEAGNILFLIAEGRDITERAEAMKTQRLLSAIVESSDDAIISKDLDGTILSWNVGARKIYGYPADEVVGKPVSLLVPPEMTDEIPGILERLKKGEVIKRYETERIRKDGGRIFVSVTISPICDAAGKIFGASTIARDITESRRTEMEREQYFRFFQTSSDLMCIADPNGAFRKTNPACSLTLGYSETELVARPFVEFVHPDDRQLTLEEMARQLRKGFSLNFENRYLCKDGSVRWLSWRANYAEDEGLTYATARDITEMRRTEDALRLANAYNRNLIEVSLDPLVTIGKDGKITDVSAATEAVTGFSRSELIGTDFSSYFTEPQKAREGYEQVFRTGFVRDYPLDIEHRDGTITSVLYNASIYKDDAGNVIGVFAAARDITEEKKLEEQLRHAQKMEAVGTLAGGIAHDFNNILNVIMGYGSMVMDRLEADSPSKGQMKEVLIAADRAANLTKRLLLFSRKEVAEVKPMDVNGMVLNMEKMLSRIIGEDIRFVTDLMATKVMVMADAGQMEQVLMNLATNARDAMPKGGSLTISTELREMDSEFIKAFEYGAPGAYAVISMTDTGTGIDKEKQSRIFDPYFTTKEVGKGTGLGLSIAYGIIKQHNGHINVYSEPGMGTTFKIWLPVIEDKAEEKRQAEVLSSLKGGTETILIAEDDASLRKLTSTVLEAFGYRVITAEDGEDAVTKFMENRDRVQLVMLDMIMPKKSGKDAYAGIRKIRPDIKAIFVSGYTMDIITQKELLEEGMDYVLKPVSPKDLVKKVREVLDRKQPPAENTTI